MGPRGFFHRFHIYEKLLSQSLAEASHSETELSHCLSHTSELHLCPIPSEFLLLSLHHGTKIALSDAISHYKAYILLFTYLFPRKK